MEEERSAYKNTISQNRPWDVTPREKSRHGTIKNHWCIEHHWARGCLQESYILRILRANYVHPFFRRNTPKLPFLERRKNAKIHCNLKSLVQLGSKYLHIYLRNMQILQWNQYENVRKLTFKSRLKIAPEEVQCFLSHTPQRLEREKISFEEVPIWILALRAGRLTLIPD